MNIIFSSEYEYETIFIQSIVESIKQHPFTSVLTDEGHEILQAISSSADSEAQKRILDRIISGDSFRCHLLRADLDRLMTKEKIICFTAYKDQTQTELGIVLPIRLTDDFRNTWMI